MHQENYSLLWHTYTDHLRDMMKNLMMNDDFADVTLVSEDKKHIKAHKIVLSACSPVFKDIVKLEQSSKPIIYMRGINFSELESIMQFIYLGEAAFYEERINEFLAVAKSLEIEELCNAESETKNDNNEPSPSDTVTYPDNFEEQTMKSSPMINQAPKYIKERRDVVRVNGKYECDQCDKIYTKSSNLLRHRQSAHDGVKYDCDQCDYQATVQGNLKTHIQSKHEGVKYACVATKQNRKET